MTDLIAAAIRGADVVIGNLTLAKAEAEKLGHRQEYIVYLAECLANANELRERLAQLVGE